MTTTKTKLTAEKLWKAVQSEMQTGLSELHYNMFIAQTYVGGLNDNVLEIYCPNKMILEKINKTFRPMIEESVQKIGGEKYELIVKEGKKNEIEQLKKNSGYDEPLFKNLREGSSDDIRERAIQCGLNPNYRFDNYIMGETNRLAFAIANSIADNPGKMHNPFFLYSGVGLGKTHLVHAIGNKVLSKNSKANVICVSSENFMNELIESIKSRGGQKSTDKFRRKYRGVDVLIIDDIQFIAGKDQTQQEVFHTFNDLYMSQKQIIITSDRPPEDFKNIEERLTSRFRSGIMADIQKPDYETRSAILRSRRDRDNEEIPNDVINFIAENVDTNIRELEGAYQQVLTFFRAQNTERTVEIAKKALSNIIKEENIGPINLNTILKAVCNYYSVKIPDVKGTRRTKNLVIPRQVAMYLMYEITKTPYMTIGELLGGRDHTTIMHGTRKIEDLIEDNHMQMQQDIRNIRQYIFHNA